MLQNEYNLVERVAYPHELQRLCIERDIAHFPWFGLAAGFLTGKYRSREDLVKHNRGSSIERFFDHGLEVLPALDAVANGTGASPRRGRARLADEAARHRRADREREQARAAGRAVRSARTGC